MTPSSTLTMTDGQIDKLRDLFVATLNKHRSEFGSESTQLALGNKDFPPDLLKVVRKYVEKESNTVVRHVTVNRDEAPQFIYGIKNRRQYVDDSALITMPSGGTGTEEVDIVFFKLGRYVSVDELDREYEARGLKPDPYAQGQVNIDDPVFADQYPNGSQWRDQNGKAYCATFDRWFDERFVNVDRLDYAWSDYWWFAGVRK